MVMVIVQWTCFATRRPALVYLSMLEHSVNWRQVTISQSSYLRNKTCLKGRIILQAPFFCKEILSSGWPCSPRSFFSSHCRLPSSMLQVRSFKLHSRTKFSLRKSSGKELACSVTRGLEFRGRPSLDKTLTAWSQSERKCIWIHKYCMSCPGLIGSVWRRSGLKKALKTVTLLPDKPEATPCEIQKETSKRRCLTPCEMSQRGDFISQIWRQEGQLVINFIRRLQRGDIGQIGRWSLST